jgi:hypothetical protein
MIDRYHESPAIDPAPRRNLIEHRPRERLTGGGHRQEARGVHACAGRAGGRIEMPCHVWVCRQPRTVMRWPPERTEALLSRTTDRCDELIEAASRLALVAAPYSRGVSTCTRPSCFSAMVGGLILSRAVGEESLSGRILEAVAKGLKSVGPTHDRSGSRATRRSTPRADPSLRESGDRGRTGDVQLGRMSVGIEAAHVKWFTRRPGRSRERPLPLLVAPQGVRPRSDRDLRRSQGPGVPRLPGRRGMEARFLRVSGAPRGAAAGLPYCVGMGVTLR